MRQAFPSWQIGQGYGMTETSTVILSTSEHDIVVGTSGSLVPGARARVVDAETGQDVAGEGVRGELWVQSPSVTLGYLNNARATAEAFVYDDQGGRWLRTGDVAVVSRSPAGYQHFSIVDRMKELIKVKVRTPRRGPTTRPAILLTLHFLAPLLRATRYPRPSSRPICCLILPLMTAL